MAPYKICESGIARTFQLVKPFSSLTSLENVMVGRLTVAIRLGYKRGPHRNQSRYWLYRLADKQTRTAGMLSLVDGSGWKLPGPGHET